MPGPLDLLFRMNIRPNASLLDLRWHTFLFSMSRICFLTKTPLSILSISRFVYRCYLSIRHFNLFPVYHHLHHLSKDQIEAILVFSILMMLVLLWVVTITILCNVRVILTLMLHGLEKMSFAILVWPIGALPSSWLSGGEFFSARENWWGSRRGVRRTKVRRKKGI